MLLSDILEGEVSQKYFLSEKVEYNNKLRKRNYKIEVSPTLCAGYHKIPTDGFYLNVGTLRTHKDGKGFREIKSGLAPTLPTRTREDGSGQRLKLYLPHKIGKLKSHQKGFDVAYEGDSIDLKDQIQKLEG